MDEPAPVLALQPVHAAGRQTARSTGTHTPSHRLIRSLALSGHLLFLPPVLYSIGCAVSTFAEEPAPVLAMQPVYAAGRQIARTTGIAARLSARTVWWVLRATQVGCQLGSTPQLLLE